MKVRLGFVTNSSSSSFLISQNSFGNPSVSGVFGYICEIFEEVKSKANSFIMEADDRGVDNVVEDYLLGEKDPDEYGLWDYASDELDINYNDLVEAYRFMQKFSWILECENYEEYENARRKNYPDLYEDDYPFIIIDHSKDSSPKSLEYAGSSLCYYKGTKKGANANKITDLCNLAIYSEDCWLPTYVVEKLCNISEYSCRHMG